MWNVISARTGIIEPESFFDRINNRYLLATFDVTFSHFFLLLQDEIDRNKLFQWRLSLYSSLHLPFIFKLTVRHW